MPADGSPSPAGGQAAAPLRLEMGISHADFFRLLPAALAERPHSISPDEVTVDTGRGRIRIRIAPEGERRLGRMRLPVTPLELHFEGLDDEEMRTFLHRFRAAYQKGGG